VTVKDARAEPTVFVVDDDPEFRESIQLLLASVKMNVEAFASAEEFVASYRPERAGCLLTDVRMPGMSGLELQKWLAEKHTRIPVLVVTAHAEVPMAVEAMKAGAIEFVQKPYSPQRMLEQIRQAIKLDAQQRQQAAAGRQVTQLVSSLSPREREIMDLLLAGRNTKEIAKQLKLSTKTVDFHRRNLLEKMGVDNVVELSRLLQNLSEREDLAKG
jgi:RNA polymerase sigma factor (sigma-70 family)